MDDPRVTTVGRLLAKLERDDHAVFDRLAAMAAIPIDRLRRAASGERCLRPMEQLRLAEWVIRYMPSLGLHAHALRAQLVATDRSSGGDRTPLAGADGMALA